MKNKFKLSVSNTEYFINPAKKTVTCKMKFNLDGPEQAMRLFYDYMYQYDQSMIDNEVIATAKLKPGDEFDENVGMKIARAKAESLMYRRMGRAMYRFGRYLASSLSHAQDMLEKSVCVIDHNDKYLSKF